MWPLKRQLLVCLAFGTILVIVVVIVMANYKKETPISDQSGRFFSDPTAKEFEMNMIVFFSTLISTSEPSILFLIHHYLRHRMSPLLLGLIYVTVQTICKELFDFRIIHVGGTSQAVRSGIFFADVASFMFDQGRAAYYP